MTMLVSVVVPCRNAGRWVGDTLRSLASQTEPPHEIIVVDDDSDDDSIAQIAECGVGARILHASFHNAAAARDLGIREATGDWIAFQDAHDVWHADHLEQAHHWLRCSQDVAYVSSVDLLHPDGKIERNPHETPFSAPRTGLSSEDFIDSYGQSFFFPNITKVILRERLFEVGLHDQQLPCRHDLDLWLRVIHGHTWCFNPKATAIFRLPTGSDISADVVRTSFYNLKVLVKNRPLYEGRRLDYLLRRAARRAAASAVAAARDPREIELTLSLARPWLTRWEWALCQLGRASPAPFRHVHRLRRWARGLRGRR
jgi:glycosyltransferase involved in cell wall biosynthesis